MAHLSKTFFHLVFRSFIVSCRSEVSSLLWWWLIRLWERSFSVASFCSYDCISVLKFCVRMCVHVWGCVRVCACVRVWGCVCMCEGVWGCAREVVCEGVVWGVHGEGVVWGVHVWGCACVRVCSVCVLNYAIIVLPTNYHVSAVQNEIWLVEYIFTFSATTSAWMTERSWAVLKTFKKECTLSSAFTRKPQNASFLDSKARHMSWADSSPWSLWVSNVQVPFHRTESW